MRPMSVRQMHTLCYESGIEFDPANMPLELAEITDVITGYPAWEGRSLAQELYERRAEERRRCRDVPAWFAAQDVVWEPWEREATLAA